MTEPKTPDQFAGAPCRTPEHWEWQREHRASQWDWHVDGETPKQAATRRKRSRDLCFTCPATARQACRDAHAKRAEETAYTVPGVWGGRLHPDKDKPRDEDPAGYLPFEVDAA